MRWGGQPTPATLPPKHIYTGRAVAPLEGEWQKPSLQAVAAATAARFRTLPID